MTGPVFLLVTITASFQQYMQSLCDQHKGQTGEQNHLKWVYRNHGVGWRSLKKNTKKKLSFIINIHNGSVNVRHTVNVPRNTTQPKECLGMPTMERLIAILLFSPCFQRQEVIVSVDL